VNGSVQRGLTLLLSQTLLLFLDRLLECDRRFRRQFLLLLVKRGPLFSALAANVEESHSSLRSPLLGLEEDCIARMAILALDGGVGERRILSNVVDVSGGLLDVFLERVAPNARRGRGFAVLACAARKHELAAFTVLLGIQHVAALPAEPEGDFGAGFGGHVGCW